MRCIAYRLYPILLIVLAMVLGACRMVTPTALDEAPASAPAGTEGEPSASSAELTLETLAGLWKHGRLGVSRSGCRWRLQSVERVTPAR